MEGNISSRIGGLEDKSLLVSSTAPTNRTLRAKTKPLSTNRNGIDTADTYIDTYRMPEQPG
jgi:hypothetical protein